MKWLIIPILLGIWLYSNPTANAQEYERAEFGTGWLDLDRNGCNTRIDVLKRDMPDEVYTKCSIKSGSLIDLYTGSKLVYPDTAIEIDHVVALADAWYSGAQYWSYNDRTKFANDMSNLIPTSRSINRTKSDKGPDEWLPPSNPCAYVFRYHYIKIIYKLVISPAQYQVIKECNGI